MKQQVLDEEGRPIGTANNNLLLDGRMYEVEYLDSTTEILSANTIAENLMAQVDDHGHRQLLLDEIVDHRVNDDALTASQSVTYSSTGVPSRKKTTKGWELFVQWRDGSGNWVSLKDLKESYPVELAEYAIQMGIDKEPSFIWWVPYLIKKRTAIISKIKSKYWDRTHKYGIRIPKSVKEVFEIDQENKNKLWQDAIELEMKNVKVALELCETNPKDLMGYKHVGTHMIFDIKLGKNYRRKARLLTDGHRTKTPASVTYSSVVSRDSVIICLIISCSQQS